MAILIDGQIISYKELGRGRPVVFLHSWIGSWRYWFPAMQFITKSFHAYGLDMLGFGESTRSPDRYTIDQQAKLLSQFLDELGIGKIALIGHGLGALVGFEFCSRWPQSVDRMMAVNCPLSYDAINSRLWTSSSSDLVHWLAGKSRDVKKVFGDETRVEPRAIEISIDSFRSNNPFDKMRQTQIPCLLLHGGKDPAIQAPPTNTILPEMMQQIIFDKSGHFPMIDEEARFNRILMEFLTLDSSAYPRNLRL
jgi:pimeloyl-ACP methyl ester carboxylesterase